MGTQLHQVLRTLCFNTAWKYAVFWKLTHRARMMLTWEDAYYDNHEQHDPSENMFLSERVDNSLDGHYSHDPLGLAVANMSYHVYSLGEGIVGQVAATGKHMWIFPDKHVSDACSSLEYCNGWQTQFSAGIRTILVVAVVPHGVVQLGSLNEITEDSQLVNRIKNSFLTFQGSTLGHIPSVMQCGTKSSLCMSDRRCRGSKSFDDCVNILDRIANTDMLRTVGKSGDLSCTVPSPGRNPKKTVEMINKHGGLNFSSPEGCGSAYSVLSRSEIFLMDQQRQVNSDERTASIRERIVGTSSTSDYFDEKYDQYNVVLPASNSGLDNIYFPQSLSNSATFDLQNQKDLVKNLEFEKEFSLMDALDMSYKFSAGCELYEALGSSFGKHNIFCDLEVSKNEPEKGIDMPAGIGSSSPLREDSENLLEAVVGSVFCSSSDVKSEKSICKSAIDLPTCDKNTIGSGCLSFVEETMLKSLSSSETYGVRSLKGFPSTSASTCSELLERPQEQAKVNRKRSRPGENCRPRPRDRQLIQERIKELRELVPNVSKCSIDSLLERTIKHMLFLQSITKHADKLSKCTEPKLHTKEIGVRGLPSYEAGSSWAVEVGNQLKVCPIRVENINMDGQMVIEMMCEKCCHFLEIAEAVRSLGLSILKGSMEDYGENTCIRFVVEGQNNRSLHRMDILWSLVQMLQPNTSI